MPSSDTTAGGVVPAGPQPGVDVPDLGIPDLEIRHEIARGGFGVVYEAQQTALNRTVAVKLLLAEVKDEKVRIRFERECTAMGLLSDHPHIITVFDAGFSPTGQPYILMDFMTGGSLAETIERNGPMDWTDVLDVMVKLSSALETAHRSGVLHRDMKPENVLWSAYGQPELGDFGIARLAGGPETRTDTLTASIAHVAPELLAGDPPSVATDLYALGSTCYVLLSGRSAFLRDTDESIVPALTRITSEPVPDLRRDGVPGEVAALVERLMAKDPAERFDSALELAVEVQGLQRRLGLAVTPVHVSGESSFPDAATGTGAVDVAAALDRAVGALPADREVAERDRTGPAVPPGIGGETRPGATAPAASTQPPPPDAATARTPDGSAPTAPVPAVSSRRRRPAPVLAAVAAVVLVAVAAAALVARSGSPEGDPQASGDVAGPSGDGGSPTGAQEATLGEDGGEILDVTQVAAQIAEIRGLPLSGNFDVRRYPADRYSALIRAYAGGAQRDELEDHGRVLTALRLVPRDIDYPDLVRELWDEQFHGFYDESKARVHVRGEGGSLSALERSVLADELMIALLDSSFDLSALHDAADDLDADRAVSALIKGDTFVSSGVWRERFLTAEETAQRDADLGLLPDVVGRRAPLAVRGEFVFPFVAGPELVRSLFAEGGVDALNAAYADPPTTTEQVLHPDKYAAREAALPVEVAAAPEGDWSELVRRTFGEYDLQQLLADLEADVADDAAAGWGGGQLAAWTRGEETAVAVWLEMDTPADAAAACEAIPVWYLLSGGAPDADETYVSPEDAMAVSCDGAAVRFSIAPDAETARSLLA